MQLLRGIAPIVAEDLLNYFDSIYVSSTLRIVQRNGNNIVRHTPPLFPKELWNVCQATVNDETRTNNQCEGWNTRFLHLVGQHHPAIWKIIKSIKLEERMVATSMAQHEVGNLNGRKRSRYYVELHTRLRDLCIAYGERNINFLRAAGYNIRFNE